MKQAKKTISPHNTSRQPSKTWLPYVLIGGLILVLYGNSLTLDYALDDYLVITGNSYTKQGIAGIPDILTNDSFTGFFGKQRTLVAGGRYRPLSQIMFAIEYQLFGANPFIGHLFNLLWYILLGWMIYKVLHMIFKRGNQPWYLSIPFIATLLFLAHPIHTEAVANIKGRDEILSMLGSMLAWFYTLRYVDRPDKKHLLFAGIAFFLALMSKENAITFLAVIPLSLYFFRDKTGAIQYLKAGIPLLLASMAYLGLRYNALGYFLGGAVETEILNNPYILASAQEKIATNLYTWGRYLQLLLWPHPLTHDYYPFHIAYQTFADGKVILSLLFISGLISLAAWLFKGRHLISFALLFGLATFSISSNVVFNIGTFMNERFLFVPSLGFALILAWIMIRLFHKSKKLNKVYLLFIPILIGYTAKTISRNPAWQDDYTLFTTDVQVSSNSVKCLVSAGGKTMERYEAMPDHLKDIGDIDRAIGWLEKGTQLHPRYFAGWEQLGKAYFLREDLEASWRCFEQCLNLNAGSQASFDNQVLIARAAALRKKHELATRFWSDLFRRQSSNTSIASQYADHLAFTGDPAKSMEVLKEALGHAPEDYTLLGKKGEIWGRYLNRMDSSEVYLRRAVAISPSYTAGLENLGVVCGMTGRSAESLEWLLKALATDPNNPRILTNLANTYQILGDKANADLYMQRASVAETKQP